MNFFDFLDSKMMPVMAKIGTQRHIMAIRDGVIATIPLTVIGGLSLIIANPPTFIYLPFFRVYEKQFLRQEAESQAQEQAVAQTAD